MWAKIVSVSQSSCKYKREHRAYKEPNTSTEVTQKANHMQTLSQQKKHANKQR